MVANPFTYTKPISSPRYFIGRQREVEQIFSRLRNDEFESTSIVGEHNVGKTSLLNYLAHPDVYCLQGFDPNKYIVVYVDLQTLGSDVSPIQLWQRLFGEMTSYCRNPEVKKVLEEAIETDVIDTFALSDVFDSIDENNLSIVFLLDQFEQITESKHFDINFFYVLRSLAIQHHLALVTSSRHELIELSHSAAIRSSPFFNIFANINLGLFSEAEAQQFISLSLAETYVSFTEQEIDFILRIAGCHPYFLQVACFYLFDAYAKKLSLQERITYLASSYFGEARSQMLDYWCTSNDQEKIVLLALALLGRQPRVDEQIFSLKELLYARSAQTLTHLEKRSLLVSKADNYSLFNTAFGDWICEEIGNTKNDSQSYTEWLRSNKGMMERLSNSVKQQMVDILPKINVKYRGLIVSWASDSRSLTAMTALLRNTVGIH